MAGIEDRRAFCVLDYHVNQSVTVVQRHFRTRFGEDPPSGPSIRKWYSDFTTRGCICRRKSSGRPAVSEETVDRIRESFTRSPQKSTIVASRELQIPKSTVWKVLRKRLKFHPYRLQMMQFLKEEDKMVRRTFCENMQTLMENDDEFFESIVFSDECTFHLSGKVNKHNVRIWGSEKPNTCVQHVRDSPKVNVFCALSVQKVYGPFFFVEKTIGGFEYLDMLQQWLLPQLEQGMPNVIFQQDGAPPHFHNEVRLELNTRLTNRWIGRVGNDDKELLPWPPRSPDLTPLDFFLWGYVKDLVYKPPLPETILDLRGRITAAIGTVDHGMLQRTWAEMDYRLDVCRVTNGAHIEHL